MDANAASAPPQGDVGVRCSVTATPTLFSREQAQARQDDLEEERLQRTADQLDADKQRLRNAEEKGEIIRYINSLSNEERNALESDFRRYLADSTVPAFIAKKFQGNETWIADPLIKRAALVFLRDRNSLLRNAV